MQYINVHCVVFRMLRTAAEKVGAILFLEKVSVAKDWSNVITSEELFTFLLPQQEFERCLLSQKEVSYQHIYNIYLLFLKKLLL